MPVHKFVVTNRILALCSFHFSVAPNSVLCGAPHKTEFGAAWKKTSGAGREYLSVKLDDPSFPAPIFASLVAVEGGDGYVLIWSRRSGD